MGQLTNTWTGPVVGTHVPDPSGMTKNESKPPLGTNPVPDPAGMTSQKTSTTHKTNPDGSEGDLMTRGEEQLHEALTSTATDSFSKQMAGMVNADGHAMNTDKWPKEGAQVPDPAGMINVGDHAMTRPGRIIEAEKDAAGKKWPVVGTHVPDPAGMQTADDMGETAIRNAQKQRDSKSEGAMIQTPEVYGGHGLQVSQERLQGLLGNIPGFDGPAPRFVQPASGEVDLHRRAVEIANGFQMPIQYSMKFKCPQGINQPKILKVERQEVGSPFEPHSQNRRNYTTTEWMEGGFGIKGYVEEGGLDWQSHLMNSSVNGGYSEGHISNLYNNAAQVSQTIWDPQRGGKKEEKQESILNLFCSKVSMPEKSINFQSMRHYGTHFAYPQSVSYGTMSTSFYCDASMHIKKFFDAWQKLIFNDITGNFNYYAEYTSEFDIFTRSVVGAGESAAEQDKNWFEKGQDSFREIMDTVNKYSGLQGRSGGPHRTYSSYKYPKMEFRNTYGVKVMECWPQIVGSVDLGHASTNSIAEFTVTWAYKKWNTFNLGEIGKRGQVNLSNSVLHEKGDGIPFVQDMPQELRGPLTQAADQSIMSQPLQRGFAVTG